MPDSEKSSRDRVGEVAAYMTMVAALVSLFVAATDYRSGAGYSPAGHAAWICFTVAVAGLASRGRR